MYSVGEEYYLSQFPEALFPCHKDLLQEYKEKVVDGIDLMNRSSVAICGVARNSESILPNTIARINRLSRMFCYCDFFIYENDSSDKTVEILKEWERSNWQVTVQTEKLNAPVNIQDTSLARREAMAYCRNKYLKMCRDSKQPYDYIIILDMDILGGYSYEGIANSFGWSEIWDVCGSNGLAYLFVESELKRIFYDSWAFRRLNHYEPHDSGEINELVYDRGESPIRVFSDFGGLAIYKGGCILDNDYQYTSEDCDHPTFNRQLTLEGKTVWLNPSMIVLYSEWEYTKCQSQ